MWVCFSIISPLYYFLFQEADKKENLTQADWNHHGPIRK